ncbi:hypothetical protein [Haloechinothrix salitolerans]|uniref:Uncharacterized protein n=1 Tax=Haloechinothrix salitolerans TaxID=926830 RepID=A0ABW2CA32_9PSEU
MSTPVIPDTGDVVDPTAPDPTPDEITDPAHPDYVEPAAEATPAAEGV